MKAKIKKHKKPTTGTREWANSNFNFISGCFHDCKYCYAKTIAIRFKRKTAEDWHVEEVKHEKLDAKIRKCEGTVMLASAHDLTQENAHHSIRALRKLLEAGNNVLVVTKPHLVVIREICFQFSQYKQQILFRFTIGSDDSATLKFWEPNASTFEERFASLEYAYTEGYKTSVSCEPALDGNTYELVQKMMPYATDTIWIGLANRLKGNLKLNGHADAETWVKADELKKIQSQDWVYGLYEKLADNPKIRWKDSCKKILKIEQPTVAGLDI